MDVIKKFEPFFGEWYAESFIGAGSFGRVYKIYREELGHRFYSALKYISIPANEEEIKQLHADGLDEASISTYYGTLAKDIFSETKLMDKLRGNTNIVSFEDSRVVPKPSGVGYDIFIRMELLESLQNRAAFRPLEAGETAKLGYDISGALMICAEQGIIHRDIKPDNIFINPRGDYKLGDFGIARQLEKTTTFMSKKDTYNYMAPEVYKGEKYGASCDLYSLGLVMYRLLNRGRLPFLPPAPEPLTPNDKEVALQNRLMGKTLPMPCEADGRLGAIVLKACAYDPKDRYRTASEMRRDLKAYIDGKSVGERFFNASGYDPNATISANVNMQIPEPNKAENRMYYNTDENSTVSVRKAVRFASDGREVIMDQRNVQGGKVFCVHCGAQIDADSVFCPSCGKSVAPLNAPSPAPQYSAPQYSAPQYQPAYSAAPAQAPAEKKKKGALGVVIGVAAGLVLLGVLGFCLWYFVLRDTDDTVNDTHDASNTEQNTDRADPSDYTVSAATPVPEVHYTPAPAETQPGQADETPGYYTQEPMTASPSTPNPFEGSVITPSPYTPQPQQPEYVFYDSTFERAFRSKTGLTGPITQEDLNRITVLEIDSSGLTDIRDVANMPNLRELYLRYNNIYDISPIAGLRYLQILKLNNNEHISDISALSGLYDLRVLALGTNNISDLSPLRDLRNLQELHLKKNSFTSVQPLAGLTELTYLTISNNNVSDVSPLYGLTKLRTLKIAGLPISDYQYQELKNRLPNCSIER